MGKVFKWLVFWTLHSGLWLLYTGQVSTWELLVGCAAATLATWAMASFRRLGLVKFSPSLKQFAEVWRLPQYAVSGTWEILQGVARQLFSKAGAPSYLAAVRFEVGPDNARHAGRRALALLYTTMTPNFVVIGVVREQGLLLYHQILPGDVLQITKDLGAKP